MKETVSILTFCTFLAQLVSCQNTVISESISEPTILYHINSNVKNGSEDYFKEIYSNWQNYLNSNNFVRRDSEFWNQDTYEYPEYSYVTFLLDLMGKTREGAKTQCSVVGIVPVENDYYLVKSVFTSQHDSSGVSNIDFIITVYAKKNKDTYEFYSSTQYCKEIYQVNQIGDINYIVHPLHTFNKNDAIRMNEANSEIAKQFESPPIKFDYVVANDTRNLSDITGTNLFSYSYQPVASGGMADTYNNVIYAGNNSEYYPHELVHLYTSTKFPRQYHPWMDEGIAALIGGSTGYEIEWHWEKLRRFIAENPDYTMDNLTDLQTQIPNGEFITDFRYPIGALICQRIIEKEGMTGIFDALQAGRSEDEYFDMLTQKLNVNRATFGDYVKAEIMKLTPIPDAEMDSYKY